MLTFINKIYYIKYLLLQMTIHPSLNIFIMITTFRYDDYFMIYM